MEKLTSLKELLKTHHIALTLEEVWRELHGADFDQMYVRDLSRCEFHQLSEIVAPPFILGKSGGICEIKLLDLINNDYAFFRLAGDGVVEIKNKYILEWCPVGMTGTRIYIPNSPTK